MSARIDPSSRRVKVEATDEVGIVFDEGKNFGTTTNIYAVGVFFESSGEVRYYDKGRVTTVEPDASA